MSNVYANIDREHAAAVVRCADMRQFVLKGRAGPVFNAVRRMALLGGTVPSVLGITPDGKHQTTARLVDIDDVTKDISR